MTLPKTSIIVSVYKDTEALEFILESLKQQSVPADQIIISEDGDSAEMKTFVDSKKGEFPNLIHLSQPDVGWRKNIALNNAIKAAENEYLIFIDGDCIPYGSFIEAHAKNAQKGVVLCGKRFELGPNFTEKLKKKEITPKEIEKKFLWYLPSMIKDHARHVEDGFHLGVKNFLTDLIHDRPVRHIVGCNFSCYKEDFLAINGFDETFELPSEGEDVDPSWRFFGMGFKLQSCRSSANIMHLYHPKRFNAEVRDFNKAIIRQRWAEKAYFCKNGIIKV